MAAGMLVLVVGSLAAYLIIASILDLRLARRLEQIAHTERTRGVWVERSCNHTRRKSASCSPGAVAQSG